jgi:hypothetical protein
MVEPTYKERYCAFLDILGFAEIVKTIENGVPFQKLKYLLDTVHKPHSGVAIDVDETDFRAQSISDAVAISANPTTPGLLQICDAVERLSLELLEEGYFVRGAIVKDKLYHDDNTVFGSALVRAFQLEQEVVRYPRVMVVSDVANSLYDEARKCIQQAGDGPYFVHVLRTLEGLDPNLFGVNTHGMPTSKYSTMRHMIQRRFREAVDNPHHFEKVQWFSRYWNSVVSPNDVTAHHRIKGPGLDVATAVWG